ncbi:hypothetical protein GE300_01920 [Rhodobacteraceae bacterium 2CG4]|uniref:Alpha-ribazole phosphatase n=1 Tax=Halovulum marinum TaxID=2662447 RepID=A0A6L5YWY6_9RHOB|nr:histidine phosphatase family protein [Halovulum marinum]MSU88372.1 hypothetical protein [Halovulum marinum]
MGLTLLRHPSVSVRGICYGRAEVRLAAGHAGQIARAVALTPPPRRVVASPAIRCRGLAQALCRAHGLGAPTWDPRLLELDFGDWEGRPWSAIPRGESDPWAEDPVHRAPPGGERFVDLQRRVVEALAGLEDAAVVTHAGPIRAALIAAGQADFAQAFATPVPHAEPIALPAARG